MESETGKHWTYSQLCELVPRVAGGLAASGVGLGDRVLCLTPVHVDYPLYLLAVMYRGAIVVPINPTINTGVLRLNLEEIVCFFFQVWRGGNGN